jgi:hypothetical protein
MSPAVEGGGRVEAWFTGAGVLVAVVALAVSGAVARQQTRIQERLAAIEEARRREEVAARSRAEVTAALRPDERDHRGRNLRLVLRNEGPAIAYTVKAKVDEGTKIPTVHGLEALPVDLQPGQEMKFPVAAAMGDMPTFGVLIEWSDELAEDNGRRWTLQTFG